MEKHESTYNINHAVLGLNKELERLKIQAMMGWDKEFRNLQWYGLENGMDVLEIGSGPGFITEQLISRLPDSHITCLDIDDRLLEHAKNLLTQVSPERINFVNASVYNTGIPDHSFDFAIARLLFLHLYHPIDAAREIYRVLKPGGKLVIIDVDDGIFGAVEPDIESLSTVLRKIANQVAMRGGNRFIGRSLPRLLMNSGFTEIDIDSVIQHSDIHGIDGFKRQFDISRFLSFHKNNVISEEEFEQLKQASDALVHSTEAYAMMTFIMAYGKKPFELNDDLLVNVMKE